LKGAGEYNRLMALYWPEESLSEKEKIKKTANRVGLSVPSDDLSESDLKELHNMGNTRDKNVASS
jgi:hypothetical protein